MNIYKISKENYTKNAEMLSGFIFKQDAGDFMRIKFVSIKFEKYIKKLFNNYFDIMFIKEV